MSNEVSDCLYQQLQGIRLGGLSSLIHDEKLRFAVLRYSISLDVQGSICYNLPRESHSCVELGFRMEG